jgi:hypothetical protein
MGVSRNAPCPCGSGRKVWTVPGNPMHAAWDDTVHGHIEIEGRELRAEVNSAESAARLEALPCGPCGRRPGGRRWRSSWPGSRSEAGR